MVPYNSECGLTYSFQMSMDVHHSALMFVPIIIVYQCACVIISPIP